MRQELESGEGAVIQGHSSRQDEVYFCRKLLGRIDPDLDVGTKPGKFGATRRPEGVFSSTEDALRAIEREAQRAGFFPNIYSVNERRNVTQLGPKGEEI